MANIRARWNLCFFRIWSAESFQLQRLRGWCQRFQLIPHLEKRRKFPEKSLCNKYIYRNALTIKLNPKWIFFDFWFVILCWLLSIYDLQHIRLLFWTKVGSSACSVQLDVTWQGSLFVLLPQWRTWTRLPRLLSIPCLLFICLLHAWRLLTRSLVVLEIPSNRMKSSPPLRRRRRCFFQDLASSPFQTPFASRYPRWYIVTGVKGIKGVESCPAVAHFLHTCDAKKKKEKKKKSGDYLCDEQWVAAGDPHTLTSSRLRPPPHGVWC